MRPIGSLCATLCLVACSTLAIAATEQPGTDQTVQRAAEHVMQQHNIPGLAIALTVNGKQRFYNFGVSSRETQQLVTSDTLFEIGSISKTFTATLATYAQASGALSLADRPSKYLPSLQGSHFDKITLVNLGTHTAGGLPLQVPEEIQSPGQLMAYFKAWQPDYAPSSNRTYSNPGTGMLGMIAAKSLNLPIEKALEQRLFSELGMPNSYVKVPEGKMPLYAQGYTKEDVPARLNPGVLAAEAYGVKSSARDMLRFVEANLGFAELDATLQQALVDTRFGYFEVGAMTQALIWEQYRYPVTLNTLLTGNAPNMAYETNPVVKLTPPLPPEDAFWVNKTGSTNGFGAYAAFVPAKQTGIVLLANKNYPITSRVSLAHQILSELD